MHLTKTPDPCTVVSLMHTLHMTFSRAMWDSRICMVSLLIARGQPNPRIGVRMAINHRSRKLLDIILAADTGGLLYSSCITDACIHTDAGMVMQLIAATDLRRTFPRMLYIYDCTALGNGCAMRKPDIVSVILTFGNYCNNTLDRCIQSIFPLGDRGEFARNKLSYKPRMIIMGMCFAMRNDRFTGFSCWS